MGGGLGNVTLLSVAKALKSNNCKVIYIAGYKTLNSRFYQELIEEAADKVIWCCEEDILAKNRPFDISIKGNVVDGMVFIDEKIEEVICAGSSSMMSVIKNNKHLLASSPSITCSINSLMQCMMKGICGQCITKTLDGNYIFACGYQDQDASLIDFDNLKIRQKQNSLQEKISLK